ncbi:dirigent protein 21-like [Rutidosis leptorrhynchoides]|uniref:dirigent protein 21-like n=1 Tax=Rutidosis leptorrhynchoides TaxID=125765 RepID=UPI003A98EDAB
MVVHSISRYLLIILSLFLFSLVIIECKSIKFSTSLSPKSLDLKIEKLTHLHFYLQAIIGGDHPSEVKVAGPNTSFIAFGTLEVEDDNLTVSPDVNSMTIGRAQGILASADQNELAYLNVLIFEFTKGVYANSTLSLLGRNQIDVPNREIPIVGGSGVFRLSRGFAITSRIRFIPNSSVVLVFGCYVLHY